MSSGQFSTAGKPFEEQLRLKQEAEKRVPQIFLLSFKETPNSFSLPLLIVARAHLISSPRIFLSLWWCARTVSYSGVPLKKTGTSLFRERTEGERHTLQMIDSLICSLFLSLWWPFPWWQIAIVYPKRGLFWVSVCVRVVFKNASLPTFIWSARAVGTLALCCDMSEPWRPPHWLESWHWDVLGWTPLLLNSPSPPNPETGCSKPGLF